MSVNFGCFGLIPAAAEVVAEQSQQNINMMVLFQARFEQPPAPSVCLWGSDLVWDFAFASDKALVLTR